MTDHTSVPHQTAPAGPLLEATGVSKAYGAVRALHDASVTVHPGEVHALLGANGAGKSTLVKILTGAVHPDSGRISIRGQQRQVHSPAEARRSGLVPVYQEPALLPDLEVIDNLRLSNTPVEPFIERMHALGIGDVDLRAIAGDLPLATLRVMDLARAMATTPEVLLLDEITAALPADLAESVLREVGAYRETGGSVIFISHRLLEVNALCDRATVLRDGETVGVVDIGSGAEDQIVELMLGPTNDSDATAIHSRIESIAPPGAGSPESSSIPRLRLRNLSYGSRLSEISLDLRVGEVLGLVALEGQGQDELFAILSGAARPTSGSLQVDGQTVSFGHPADAIAHGLVLVPGDRSEGLLPQRSVRENIALPSAAPPRAWGPIDMKAEGERVRTAIERLQIDTRAQREVRRLSGGNQQKVTIAKWIAGGVETLLCFDPTRGIDIRTKRQIYHLLRDLAATGSAVLLYTSELEEVPLACDRAVVMFSGRMVAEIPATEADEATLMRAAHGLPVSSDSQGRDVPPVRVE